jgi:hypothetical protein
MIVEDLSPAIPDILWFRRKKTKTICRRLLAIYLHRESCFEDEDKTDAPQQPVKENKQKLQKDIYLVKLLGTAVGQTSDDGWTELGGVGHCISNISSFSFINYGYKKLSDLIKVSELFGIEMRRNGKSVYIRGLRKQIYNKPFNIDRA